MFEYSNELFQSALSVSSFALAGSNCMRQPSGTSAQHFFETEQAISQIDEFADLENGWAGSGSLAPSRQIREIAKAAVRTPRFMNQIPDISAMPNGTIAFDWEAENGSANLEIGADKFSFYLDLEGTFFPLSGSSLMLPVMEIAEIVSYCFSPMPPLQRTRPTSYSEKIITAEPLYA
jgi:hypothetical protein